MARLGPPIAKLNLSLLSGRLLFLRGRWFFWDAYINRLALLLIRSKTPDSNVWLAPQQASWGKTSKALVDEVEVYKAENGDRYAHPRRNPSSAFVCSLQRSL